MRPRTYGVASLFAGLGGKTLGCLRARGRDGSRFESVGAFDIEPEACADFEHITGAKAQAVDIGALSPAQLAERCTRRPDVVVMSPPCKGWSGCLPEAMSRSPRYQALNSLALYSVDLVLEAWPTPPALILLENVPRMLTRGRAVLEQIKALLRAKGYVVDLDTHNCAELGPLAQNRERVLLVARLPALAPTALLRPPRREPLPMSSVLWRLPVPTPGSLEGGSMHALPKLSALNWLRLAAIRAGKDWRDLPEAVRLPGLGSSSHAGKYGVQDQDAPAHTVISEARTGKGWSEVADPRLAPRPARQNGGFGVNDSGSASHAVVAEGSVRNTWGSVADVRLSCSPRAGTMGVEIGDRAAHTVIGQAGVHKSSSSIADPRVLEQHRGNYGVQDPSAPSMTIRGKHVARTAPGSVADGRGFTPSHRLVAGQGGLDVARPAWTGGAFELIGPELDLAAKGRPTHLVIDAPDGTYHRPLTTLELAVLQGLPAWHRPGDPTELALGEQAGRWLELGGSRKRRRERIGNAVPPPTAQAIAEQVLDVLDAGAEEVFRLSSGGIWVAPGKRPSR